MLSVNNKIIETIEENEAWGSNFAEKFIRELKGYDDINIHSVLGRCFSHKVWEAQDFYHNLAVSIFELSNTPEQFKAIDLALCAGHLNSHLSIFENDSIPSECVLYKALMNNGEHPLTEMLVLVESLLKSGINPFKQYADGYTAHNAYLFKKRFISLILEAPRSSELLTVNQFENHFEVLVRTALVFSTNRKIKLAQGDLTPQYIEKVFYDNEWFKELLDEKTKDMTFNRKIERLDYLLGSLTKRKDEVEVNSIIEI